MVAISFNTCFGQLIYEELHVVMIVGKMMSYHIYIYVHIYIYMVQRKNYIFIGCSRTHTLTLLLCFELYTRMVTPTHIALIRFCFKYQCGSFNQSAITNSIAAVTMIDQSSIGPLLSNYIDRVEDPCHKYCYRLYMRNIGTYLGVSTIFGRVFSIMISTTAI